jgi:hypothetical protein
MILFLILLALACFVIAEMRQRRQLRPSNRAQQPTQRFMDEILRRNSQL